MSEPGKLKRRHFNKAVGVAWVSTLLPRPLTALAASSGQQRMTLAETEWQLVEQLCSRILPSGDSPGATEAGCVNFIDKALAAEDSDALPRYRAALRAFVSALEQAGIKHFGELPTAKQDEWLHALENNAVTPWQAELADAEVSQADFFATLRVHTIMGFLADPKYGGNRNYVGWKHASFHGPAHHMGGATDQQLIGQEPMPMIWEK